MEIMVTDHGSGDRVTTLDAEAAAVPAAGDVLVLHRGPEVGPPSRWRVLLRTWIREGGQLKLELRVARKP